MTEPRLKSRLWVQAAVRQCDIACVPALVVRKGDADAGAVLLKVNRAAAGCEVLTQIRTTAGAAAWMRGTGAALVAEAAADAYIARQVERDGDLWVVEIEAGDKPLPLDLTLV